MGHSVQRWLACTGAVAAFGASACGQLGAVPPAQAAPKATGSTTAASGVTAAYVPPTTNLYFGNSGPAVSSVQQRLNALGYYAGPPSDQYGANLEEAVWAFKEVQGLPMNEIKRHNSVITAAFEQALINPRTPFARYPHGGPGRIEVNQDIQVLVLYRNNAPYLILHVSTGGNCLRNLGCGWKTPDGKYHALSFFKGTFEAGFGPLKNPIFFIGTVFAIHGGEPVPWYPDSHGCVRIGNDVVNWFHKRIRIGVTRIDIFGTAPYQPRLAG
jgi:peptidoglycan hydrolase-like protein with peptidoglycan-binding domain